MYLGVDCSFCGSGSNVWASRDVVQIGASGMGSAQLYFLCCWSTWLSKLNCFALSLALTVILKHPINLYWIPGCMTVHKFRLGACIFQVGAHLGTFWSLTCYLSNTICTLVKLTWKSCARHTTAPAERWHFIQGGGNMWLMKDTDSMIALDYKSPIFDVKVSPEGW